MVDKTNVSSEYDAAALTLREQERLGQELHDTLGPQLTAISMLAAGLHNRLQARNAAETGLAAKLLARIEQAKTDVRAFTKGLLPVDCDAEGLMVALADLAEQTEETHHVACWLECARPVNVSDNFTATRLYRIAKEAVHNAVKHAECHKIIISLSRDNDLILHVRDDGRGISADARDNDGHGLEIMRHRCELIGGKLDVRPSSEGGTIVTCAIAKGHAKGDV